MIKPIETIYNGYRFRSRLEARWAVFFDACKIKYQYEPQGFVLDSGKCYLPDFYLPQYNTFVEIKPNDDEEIENAKKVLIDLVLSFNEQDASALLCVGDPYDDDMTLFSSDVGGNDDCASPAAEYKCSFYTWCDWLPDDEKITYRICDKNRVSLVAETDEFHKYFLNRKVKGTHEANDSCIWFSLVGYECLDDEKMKARQARFEHGERG